MIFRLLAPIVLLFVGLTIGWAQTITLPPQITELQRLQVQTVIKDLEIAQLKAQAAQRDFDAARTALTALTQALQVEGYTLDLQTFRYSQVEGKK